MEISGTFKFKLKLNQKALLVLAALIVKLFS